MARGSIAFQHVVTKRFADHMLTKMGCSLVLIKSTLYNEKKEENREPKMEWVRHTSQAIVSFLLLSFFLTSCGVKPRDASPIGSDQNMVSDRLPVGIAIGKNKKILFSTSGDTLIAGEVNKLSYTLVTEKLNAADLSGVTLEISYRMPKMAQMGTYKSVAIPSGPGKFDASYDISMGGDWEIRVALARGEEQIDEAVFYYNVSQ